MWYWTHKSTMILARTTCVGKDGLGCVRWGRSRKMRSSCAYSALPSCAWIIWSAWLEKRGGGQRDKVVSREVGRHSHETEPSWSWRGGPVVQSATGSRAAMPTRRRERRHSSSIFGREKGPGGARARGRPDAFSARAVLSRFASRRRMYSGSRGLPPVLRRKVSVTSEVNDCIVGA